MAEIIDNNETRELIEFYRLGLDSIIQGDYSIVCFDGKNSSWLDERYHPSTEYVIVIEKTGIVDYQTTIDSFFGITSYSPSNNKLLLGGGDKISNSDPIRDDLLETISADEEKNTGLEISTHAVLPSYLDNLIYGEFFGAKYQPNYQRYDYNLNLTEEDLLIYLGTYFWFIACNRKL